MKKLVLLLFFVFMLFVLIWADCPHCFNVIEIDIITINSDTIHCYTPLYSGYDIPPETRQINRIESGPNLKLLFSTVNDIDYICEYYYEPNLGYVVCIDEVNKITISDSTVLAVFYKGSIEGFSGACGFDTISRNSYEYVKAHEFVSKFYVLQSCTDECYYNFNPSVSPLEFAIIFQCYILKASVEGGPLVYDQYEKDSNKIIEYIEGFYGINYINSDNFIETFKKFLNDKEERLVHIKKINPNHKKLVSSIIQFQEKFISEATFLYEWYQNEIIRYENNKIVLDNLNKNIKEDLKKLVERSDKKWLIEVEQNKAELEKFHSICITYSWD